MDERLFDAIIGQIKAVRDELYALVTTRQATQGPQGERGEKGSEGAIGQMGPRGERGADGTRGSVITVAAGGPAGDGQVGDLYLDSETGDVYQWR